MRKNKGQGAMEYLMTYGWAILVVMVVGIAMWRLGIFNMGGTTVTFTGFAKIKPQLAGTGLQGNSAPNPGLFVGTFTNGIGTKIEIYEVTITGDTTTCVGSTDGVDPVAGDYGGGIAVGGGDNFKISIGDCQTGPSGDVYSVDVEIEYDVTIGSQTVGHTESGTIRGPYE